MEPPWAGPGAGLRWGTGHGARDDAFIDYYTGLYDTQKAERQETQSTGSGTAAQRELDAIAFERLLGTGTGEQYLSDLRTLAAETPMEYEDLTDMSRRWPPASGTARSGMLELMTAIGDAGSAVGVTAADMTSMAQALSRMNSSGKTTLEYLNILQDRGVDVIGMLAEAMGKSQGEIYEMISKGEINGQDAVDIIQAGMEARYSGAMETMAETFSGLTSTLSDTMTEVSNAYGEGYNTTRSRGLEAEIGAYGGDLGAVMQNINRISGENDAFRENLAEQYTREAPVRGAAGGGDHPVQPGGPGTAPGDADRLQPGRRPLPGHRRPGGGAGDGGADHHRPGHGGGGL